MSKIQRLSTQSNVTLLGGFIVLIGLLLLATTNQWIGLSARNSWPISLLLPGLVLLAFGAQIGNSVLRTFFVFFGAIQSFLGLFFFTFTLEVFQWSDMGRLWPAFILIPGLAFLTSHWMSDKKSDRLLLSGGVLCVGALAATVLVLLSNTVINAKSIAPILIMVVGISLVVAPWLKNTSRRK